MDFETRKRLYALCRDEPLGPKDSRNVDFDADDLRVRGISWMQRLATPIELSDRPSFQLLTGLPGSGKSTELRRLEAFLEGPPGEPGFLVVRVDSEEALDLTQAIDTPDLIAVLVHEAEQRVLAMEGALEDAAENGYLARLWHWLSETEVDLSKAQLGAGPAKLTVEMKTRTAFRQEMRAAVGRHFTRFLQEARDYLAELDARARRHGWKGIVLILDSLEKLQGLASTWTEVLESAERVFGGGAPHLQLPVHCLYTVPPALVYRLNMLVEFVPMVKLRDRDGRRFEPGHQALRELVRRRVADGELQELLGPAWQGHLDELIQRSGGYPREVVQALRRLVELPSHPATDDDLERYHNEVRERFRSVVTDDEIPLLVRVAQEKTLPVPTEDDRPMIDRVIRNNVVLRYDNSKSWFDLHPAVLDIPQIRRRLEEAADTDAGDAST